MNPTMTTSDSFLLPQAHQSLTILVIGAGIAGLTASIGLRLSGHNVCIYEQAPVLTEVGAGIQIGPNAARILGRFGLLESIIGKANVMERNSLRRWKDDEELAGKKVRTDAGGSKSPPLSVIHRGDLQTILLDKVKQLDIPIYLNSKVLAVDPCFSARMQLRTKEWVSGDVVICADGIRSPIRAQIALANGIKEGSLPTGDAAYRVLIPKERLKNDAKALRLLSQNVGMRWMGPDGHIMAYPIKNNTIYNMVLIHPQRASQSNNENWTNKGNKTEMMNFYKDWNPMIQALLGYVPDGEVMEWTLTTHAPLQKWYQNRCVLIGDACHPMLPYVGQGAAQAIEDAGVLTCALSLIPSGTAKDVRTAFRVYEMIRKERGEKIQDSTAATRRVLHLPDGGEQRQRDQAIRNSEEGKGRNPDLWADEKWQEFMYGVDVMKDCVDGWEELALIASRGARRETAEGETLIQDSGPFTSL